MITFKYPCFIASFEHQKYVIDKNNKFTPVVSRRESKNNLIPTSRMKNISKDYPILIINIFTGNSQRDHAVIFKRKKLCLSAFRYYHGIRGILWPGFYGQFCLELCFVFPVDGIFTATCFFFFVEEQITNWQFFNWPNLLYVIYCSYDVL